MLAHFLGGLPCMPLSLSLHLAQGRGGVNPPKIPLASTTRSRSHPVFKWQEGKKRKIFY